ncbi:MAG: carboxypeptidase-like regulatory domain-containing protein [Bacteroidales bacterium]|nr:carboxypeptidase-like regulatory domain-containing protein [Bacteroidales bacterium]
MRRWALFFLLFLATVTAAAQGTTRVRGLVTDADTGEPIPFVSVYFDGTTIGISTDMDGRYSLETRSPEAKVLTASLIGYESLSVPISQGAFKEINFRLRQDPKQLNAALVKPDNRYIKSILRKLDRSREVNDPDNAPDWNSRLYSKIEFDVQNLEEIMRIRSLDKSIGFIREYADTSAITGRSFIPALISENLTDVYHSQDPSFNREVMRASRISGLEDNNALRQFTGSYLLKTNFYKDNIGVFNLVIPNPAAESSHIYYNYFLVDSLQVEGRKTYVLRFHPKKLVTSPTLDGEMQIDAEDFGIRSVHANLSGESNVNWIRHINVDLQNRRLPDGRWFYGEEHLFIDFSITVSDESRIIAFLGNRHLVYEEPVFEPVLDKDALTSSEAVVMRDVKVGDDAFWESARPYELSEREKGIYQMVDDIQHTPVYKWTYAISRTLVSNYYEVKPWGFEFGRWAQTFAYNDMEGFRMQVGGRTLKEFSTKVRLGGYVAFGFKDLRPKGQATVEWMLGREKTRKLTFDAKYDYVQFGGGYVFTVQNIFSSFLARSQSKKLSLVRYVDVNYDHEFAGWLNASVQWRTQRVWSYNGPDMGPDRVRFVPTSLENKPENAQESFSMNSLRVGLRFSFDERVNRNFFVKSYLFTKYPVIDLNLTSGFKGITRDDFSFLKATANLSWKIPSTAVGFGRLNIEGGAIWGSVPYPMLKLHDGNQTFFLDRGAYSCMDYYEFLSDRWLTASYEHNFNGFFLGKIPFIKKLDLREVATVKMAWGTLSSANSDGPEGKAPFYLPAQSKTLEKPYVEVGVGIANIFRILRIDAFWRVTHRRPEARKNFAINIGLDLEF